MRTQRGLARVAWALIAVAVGISFVGRPLTMRGGVGAAVAQAARGQAPGSSAQPMDMGTGRAPAPCSHHSGQCCAPCLACCPGCATVPVPAAWSLGVPSPAADRVAAVAADATPAIGSVTRHLQPPPIGPPSPLVS